LRELPEETEKRSPEFDTCRQGDSHSRSRRDCFRGLGSMCAAAGSSTSSTSNHLGTSPPHLVAHVTVPSIPDATFTAILDCGCSQSFIPSDLVSKFRLS